MTKNQADTPRKHNWLWCDIETTGTDARLKGARILEIAVALVADDFGGDFGVVESFDCALRATPADLAAAWSEMDLKDSTFVHGMHTRNSLLADCEASEFTLADVDAYLYEWVQGFTGKAKPTGLVLAGFSVHFDRDWIRVHMPRFSSTLSHRVFDVSTLKAAARAWLPGYDPAKGEAHRAMPDVLESIKAASEWRQAVGL